MAKKSVSCYGIFINDSEIFTIKSSGKMEEFIAGLPYVGLYQDSGGDRQCFVFKKKSQAKKAVDKAVSLGLCSAVLHPTVIYVPLDDLDERGEKDEGNCCS